LTTVSSAISSVSSFGISVFELVAISSVVSLFAVGGVDATGDFRCCSCSYSLIKRFLSGCELFDDVVGDEAIGGVPADGLFKLDD
jgi:hypothetical protein